MDHERNRSVTQLTHDLRGTGALTHDQAQFLLDGESECLHDELQRSVEVIDRQVCRLQRSIDGLESPLPREPDGRANRDPGALEATSLPRILVADDDADFLEIFSDMLAPRYRVTKAESGREAVDHLRAETFDLVILDQHMPDQSGLEIAEQLVAGGPTTPAFMFLSGDTSADVRVRGLSLGAADFVAKAVDPAELLVRVEHIIATVQRERSLLADAMSDPLTGLSNYRSLARSLELELARAHRYDLPLSLLTVDVDDLKGINDELGHSAGDDAIRIVASALRLAVRKFETVARQGGDELCILLPNACEAEALQLGERIRAKVSQLSVGGRQLSISVGVASRERGDEMISVRALVQASDEALYLSKRRGRNRVTGRPR